MRKIIQLYNEENYTIKNYTMKENIQLYNKENIQLYNKENIQLYNFNLLNNCTIE